MSEYFIRDGKSIFKFSGGQEVQIVPVPVPMQLDLEMSLQSQQPKPPMKPVPLSTSDPSQTVLEAHWDDELYRQEYTMWAARRASAYFDLYVEEGTIVENVNAAQVERIREYYRRKFMGLPEDDKSVYVKYVLCRTQEDYRDFISAHEGRNNPTERGVAAAIETFSAIG